MLPDLSQLREGDIVLTTNGNARSWFFVLAANNSSSRDQKVFSHAEMVYRDSNGQLMLGGVFDGAMSGEDLRKRFEKFYRVAVFRANCSFEKRKKAADTLLAWLRDKRLSEAEFDYSMSYEPGRTDKFFCAGIINEAFRMVGFDYPFQLRSWDPNQLTIHIEEIVGTRLKGLLDINSIYRSNNYRLVFEWQNEQRVNKTVDLSKKTILYLLEQYEKGYRLLSTDEFHLGMAFVDPSEVEHQFAQMQRSLFRFSKDVISTWRRLARRGKLNGLTDAEREQFIRAVFTQFHEKYFYYTTPAPAFSEQ